MTVLAAVLAALGACGNAFGAWLQHMAVRDTIGERGLRLRHQRELLRDVRWLTGLIALGSSAALHAWALGLAPLSVVQPVGVLALPITVLLNLRQRGVHARDLSPPVVFAVAAVTAGVASLVVLTAGSATPTAVAPHEQLIATQLVGSGVLVLGVLAVVARSTARCVLFAAGCAMAYGYVSLMMRGVAQRLGSDGLLGVDPLPLLGIATAMAVGGWLLQHAHTSGPPELVVACLAVIDPLVAVGLGIGLLDEAVRVDAWLAGAEAACALVAGSGVFALAKYRRDTRYLPATVTSGRDLAGPGSADRHDRALSTTRDGRSGARGRRGRRPSAQPAVDDKKPRPSWLPAEHVLNNVLDNTDRGAL